MALKPDGADWTIKEQIVEDPASGLTFQFEVVPGSSARFRLRVFGDASFHHQRPVVGFRVEAEDRQLEPVLPFRLAVAARRVATEAAQKGDDIIGEIVGLLVGGRRATECDDQEATNWQARQERQRSLLAWGASQGGHDPKYKRSSMKSPRRLSGRQ